MTDAPHCLVERLAADRALFQGLFHARAQLHLIEGFAAAVALDYQRHHEFGGFEGAEALRAGQTLAPPADLLAFARQTRIDDLRFDVAAKGTVHTPAALRAHDA